MSWSPRSTTPPELLRGSVVCGVVGDVVSPPPLRCRGCEARTPIVAIARRLVNHLVAASVPIGSAGISYAGADSGWVRDFKGLELRLRIPCICPELSEGEHRLVDAGRGGVARGLDGRRPQTRRSQRTSPAKSPFHPKRLPVTSALGLPSQLLRVGVRGSLADVLHHLGELFQAECVFC
jgi:hypothetical protein